MLTFFVSIVSTLLLIGCCAGICAIFVACIMDIRATDDDNDDERGGDNGFTPDPWGPSGNAIKQYEDYRVYEDVLDNDNEDERGGNDSLREARTSLRKKAHEDTSEFGRNFTW